MANVPKLHDGINLIFLEFKMYKYLSDYTEMQVNKYILDLKSSVLLVKLLPSFQLLRSEGRI